MKLARFPVVLIALFASLLLCIVLIHGAEAENDESELALYIHEDVDPDNAIVGSVDTSQSGGAERRHPVWNTQNAPQANTEREAGTWEYELVGDLSASGSSFSFKIWGDEGHGNVQQDDTNDIQIRVELRTDGNVIYNAQSDVMTVGADEVLFDITAGNQGISASSGDLLEITVYCTWVTDGNPDATPPDEFVIVYDGASFDAGGVIDEVDYVNMPSSEATGTEHNDDGYIRITALVQAAFGNGEIDSGGYYIQIDDDDDEKIDETTSPDVSSTTYGSSNKEALRIAWDWYYEDAPDGDYTAYIRCKDQYGEIWSVETGEFTVEGSSSQSYGVTLQTNPQSLTVAPDEGAEFTLTVRNTGDGTDSFEIDTKGVPSRWNVDFEPSTYVNDLDAGEEAEVTLTITPPDKDRLQESEADIQVQVVSDGSANANDEVLLEIYVEYFDMEVDLDSGEGDASPIVPATFNLNIENTGSDSDRFDIEVVSDPGNWVVKLNGKATSISEAISAGYDKDIDIDIYAPELAERGDDMDFDIKVTSNSDRSLSEIVYLTAEVTFGFKLLDSEGTSEEVDAGKKVSFAVELRNTHDVELLILLDAIDDGEADDSFKWIIFETDTGSRQTVFFVDADSTVDVNIVVKVPSGAKGKKYHFTVDAFEDESGKRAIEEPLVFDLKVTEEEEEGIFGSSEENDVYIFGVIGFFSIAIIAVVGLKTVVIKRNQRAADRAAELEEAALAAGKDSEKDDEKDEKKSEKDETDDDDADGAAEVKPLEEAEPGDVVDADDVSGSAPAVVATAATPAQMPGAPVYGQPAGGMRRPGAMPYQQGRGPRPGAMPYQQGRYPARPQGMGGYTPRPGAPVPVQELEQTAPVPVQAMEGGAGYQQGGYPQGQQPGYPQGPGAPQRPMPGQRPGMPTQGGPGAVADASVEVAVEESYGYDEDDGDAGDDGAGGGGRFGGLKGKRGKKDKEPKQKKEKKPKKGKGKKGKKKGKKGKKGKKQQEEAYDEYGADEYGEEAVIAEDYGVEVVAADEEIVVAEEEVVVEEYEV